MLKRGRVAFDKKPRQDEVDNFIVESTELIENPKYKSLLIVNRHFQVHSPPFSINRCLKEASIRLLS